MVEVIEVNRKPFYRFAKAVVICFFRLFYRWRVEGAEHVPKHGSVILGSNHIHNFDPPLVGACIERFVYFMAKEQLFRIKLFKLVIQQLGAFPVKRGHNDKSAIKQSLYISQNGGCLVIFPEGHRSRDERLQPGLPGVAFIARKAQCPIVPVAVIGPYRLFQRLTVRFGEPFLPEEGDTNDTLLAKLMERIQRLLDEGHGR